MAKSFEFDPTTARLADSPKGASANAFDPTTARLADEASEPGGLVASAKQSIGSVIKGAGQAAADFVPGVGQDNALKQYGQSMIDANPTAVTSLGDISDKPGTAVKEAVGNAAGSMGGMLGARVLGQSITAAAPLTGPFAPATALVGQGISWLGPAAVAALPSFGGIREQQIKDDPSRESDLGAKARAAVGAAAVGAIESKFGPQEWAMSALTKEGRKKVAEKFAAKSLAGSVGKGLVKGAAVEGAEELAQNPIEQVAAYQDPTTTENLKDTAFSGAMGAIGGGVMGGGFGAVSHLAQSPEKPGQLPAAQPGGDQSTGPAPAQVQVADDASGARQANYEARVRAAQLDHQERGEPAVPQTTAPDGAAILAAQAAERERTRLAEQEANRAVTTPDDEIFQSVGIDNRSPSQRMGLDPAAGPMSSAAALAVDSGAAAHVAQQSALAQAAEVAQAEDAGPAPEQIDRSTGEVVQDDEQSADPETRLTKRLDYVRNQARINGWNQTLVVERDRINAELAKLRLAQTLAQAESGKAKAPAAPASTTPDLSGRTDAQLQYLSTNGQPGYREAAAAELARRQAQKPADQVATGQTLGDPQEAPPTNVQEGIKRVRAKKAAAKGGKVALTTAPPTAAMAGDTADVAALRAKLREVEDKILAAAPDAMGQGGGDIAAALRSRKVPVPLKAQHKKIREQLRVAAEAQGQQAPAAAGQKTEPAQTPQAATSSLQGNTASWVIRNKESGEVIAETFDRKKVEALNTEKYEAVPIQQHLASLNAQSAQPVAAAQIDSAAHEAATSPYNDRPDPTQAQKEAGNYAKGHVRVQGLDITVENPRGSDRTGKRPDGSEWRHTMSDHYGYIKRTSGADGEQVDAYIGPNPEAQRVYVVDQLDQQSGGFDEHKVMMGFDSQDAAVAAYRSNFDAGWKVGPVRDMSMDAFKSWLKEGDTTKPAAVKSVVQRVQEARKKDADAQSSVEVDNHRPSKPRMGESADAVWAAIKQAAHGVVSREGGSRLLYPTLRVVGGDLFRIGVDGGLQVVDQKSGGIGVRDATPAEADEFHRDLDGDRVEVVLMTAPGYGSFYGHQKVVEVLHSPSGFSFQPLLRPAVVDPTRGKQAKPARGVLAKKAQAEEQARASYFTPGNVVKGYGGGHDRVIAYTPADEAGRWSVKVRAVEKSGDTWVDVPNERERVHATQPDARTLKAGPVGKAAEIQRRSDIAGEAKDAPASESIEARKDRIRVELDEITARAEARKAAGDAEGLPTPSGYDHGFRESAMDWMTSAELDRVHELKLSLPSSGEEMAAARGRVAAKQAARRATPAEKTAKPPRGVLAKKAQAEKEARQQSAAKEVGDVAGIDGRFSVSPQRGRRDDQPGVHRVVTEGDAKDLFARLRRRYVAMPEIRVRRTFEDLPERLQQQALERGHTPAEIKGGFHDGSLYVVTGNHSTLADLETTALHELIGHFGVRRLLGKEFGPTMHRLFYRLGGIDGLMAIAEKYGFGEDFDGYVKGMIAARANAPAVYQDHIVQALLSEELTAHIAQQKPGVRQLWREFVGFIRDRLRALGFAELPKYNDADLAYLVRQARTGLQRGGGDSGVQFSFAGRGAQGADLHALNTAQQRLARGDSAEAVRRDTGWHRGADGKWRFEISDHQARIAVGGLTAGDVIDLARVAAMADGRNQVAVGDVLAHDRLFAAYPHLADIPVVVMPESERSTAKLRSRGGKLTLEVKAGLPRAELPSVLMHELQHAIQLKEGFALGGTAKPLAGGAVSALDQAGAITYRRLAGEVEARNTQARMNMSPRARMDIAPEESADIPASQVLVTFNGRDLADLPGPRNAAGAPMTERALVRAFDRQFPNLGKALRTMLARGRAGKRGGVVLLDDADPLHIARAFTSKTGTALSKSVQLFSDAGQVNGFFDPKSGLTFLVGPNLNSVTGPAVLLHEMSHGQQREALDRRALEMLTTRGSVKNAELRAFLDRVAARMSSVGESGNAAEATAYIVEQAVMEGRSQGFAVADSRFLAWADKALGQRVGDFLRSVLAMVRSFMLRHGMGVGEVTVDDLVGYAMVGMERAARGDVDGVEPAFSRSAMKSVEANIARGRDAMASALNDRNSVHRAMFRNGLGWVDFVWGDQNKGIAHILKRRMEADGMSRTEAVRMLTDDLVEAIARGAEIRRREVGGSVRAVVEFNNHEVVLVRNPGANSWMLSGWKVSPGAAAAANDTSRATHRAADSSDDTMGAGGENNTGAEVGSATQSSATQDAPTRSRGALGAGGPIVDQDGDMNNTPGIKFSRSGLREVASRATAELDKTFSAPGGLSWWHKTVGTMYNLAQRSPAFKPVFEAAQGFVDDVSHYANDAADLAPKLLPKLDGWRDIMKAPVSAEDNKAVAGPVFEGTLSWTRGEDGKPVRVDDAAAAAARMTTAQKAEALRRRDALPEGMLRAWQALPPEQFAKMIDSRYESQLLKPGVVWTDAELRDMFKLNDGQVALYREFRAAVDRSLDTMARADMLRFGGEDVKALRQQVMDASSVQEAALLLRDHLSETADAWPGRATDLLNVANGIMERAEKVTQLQAEGYAPLSRFGKYSVDVVDQGERQYFGLFETKREANQMAEQMRAAFPGAEVSQGTMSEEAYKLFAGVTPETLELFGNALGFNSTGDSAQDRAFQQYLRLTKTNRSAMKRLIHRQGIAGYSEDVGRVLAAFVYSNARQTAAGLNLGDLTEAVDAIPKEQGELKDAAVRLAEYIKNPQEEAQAVRGLLFAQYLGGSIASAFVNMTQPVAVTFPWLSQYGGAKKAAAEIGRAAREMAAKGHQYEPDLAQALHEAEEDGTVSPQEVHQLMAQAQGRGSLRSGDGTKQGDALASASNGLKRLAFAWGKVFGLAEQANRRVTFIAAYRMAKDQGMADPAGFARQAVKETQFVYSKASKMQWGRGAVGGTLMTFKTYSIAYLELLHRMYTQGGPEGKRAALLALGVLMLMGGAGGLPFADDAADAADALAQLLGYNISVKAVRQELLEQAFGQGIAGFIEKGITGLPGAPIDVSGRLGLGNLIPGTGLLQSKTSHTSDVLEIVGPAGDFAKRVGEGAAQMLHGDIGSGLLTMAPQAVRNFAKGVDMAATGMYRDAKGYKVLDTNPLEAAAKAIGFQPQSVARIQEANSEAQQAKNFYNLRAQEIRAKWAQGIFESDPAKVQEARDEIADWNAKNPGERMLITIPSVMKRVQEMRKSKDQRIADTAPKAMRAQLRADLTQAREAL